MACTAHLNKKIDGDLISFTATCTGNCTGGGPCVPIMEPDISHDTRFKVQHEGAGPSEHNLNIRVREVVENFTFHARCKCESATAPTEGDDYYTIIKHDPDEYRVLKAIVSIGFTELFKHIP